MLLNKIKLILLLLLVFAIFILMVALNFDKISKFFSNKEWEIADSVGKIELENYMDTFGTNEYFYTINGGEIIGYSDDAKEVYTKNTMLKDVVWDTAGNFAIIAEKGSNQVYVICGSNEIWSNSINNASIL